MFCYSALDIAKYIIGYEHSKERSITNLRLQKLLYFVQAKALCDNKSSCFFEDMEAWDFGPVVPNVYYAYKIFGAMDIIERSVVDIEKKLKEKVINPMLEQCADYPTFQLVEITHEQDPWKNAREKGQHAVITKESIKDYFSKKKNV